MADLPVDELLFRIGSFLAALGIGFGFIALSWYVLWRSFVSKLKVVQELQGKRKQSKESKEANAAEIQRLKRQLSSRPSSRRPSVASQGSMQSRRSYEGPTVR